MYEFCLEYGCFPVKKIDDFADHRKEIPDFLKDDAVLIAQLEHINELFHELFLTIECRFDYVGKQFPEKITVIHTLYDDIAAQLLAKYGETEQITIELFLL
ncbi:MULTISPECIES: hypothetical protein [unclassified Streptococcus]|uniref:hypothetical protein n=1 Tax=unclassified Streptococcus TaxID=2608887 RepID=UPI0010724660|nr:MULTISPECIES: hypothetical protein [unclassified Streptococcus]MBF0786559.1 hypothetical protein [Streptococcus sp. 19428wC2_LYSM12]MCQ9210948.1 hypothetical protein [Streptococcus sp. B01]MCQ9214217.1 hypothetical protein [Streptococcus sp. O1]TFV06523.1 hypothetical protein E4T79_01270 [Streptococcus sp. LYSM12]